MRTWDFLRFWKTEVWFHLNDKLNKESFLPKYTEIFQALRLTPFNKVKCVILGQDPYPTKGHANGLAFSVQPHVRPLPKSLVNIFSEYQTDLGYPAPRSGDLTSWAQSGVLLLNSILTVEEGKPLSHAGLGWEKLTYEIVRALDERGGVVFCLWGKRAQEYQGALRSSPVVCSAHPSPLSANKGFFGSKPFSTINAHLTEPINWKLV